MLRAFNVSFNLEDFGEALRTPRILWRALRTRVPAPEAFVEVPDPSFALD